MKEYKVDLYLAYGVLFILLYCIPFGWLLINAELDFDDSYVVTHALAASLYIVLYLLSGLIINFPNYRFVLLRTSFYSYSRDDLFYIKRLMRKAWFIAVIGVFLVVLYYLSGGYKKLLLLGTEIDSWSFRIMGYDDINRWVTAVFELSRRIIMPFSLLILYIAFIILRKNVGVGYLVIITFTIFAAIVNLDRGPIFLYIVLFFYGWLVMHVVSFNQFIKGFLLLVILIGLFGSIITYLQHNIISFVDVDLGNTFFAILVDRLILDPVRMGQLLSFDLPELHSKPLYLQYSRLAVIWGANYTGTEAESSIYVSPTGLIGDVWRNFGFVGIIVTSIIHGIIFKLLSQGISRKYIVIRYPLYFLVLILSLYTFYSGIFSQGPFMLLGVLVLAILLSRRQMSQTTPNRLKSELQNQLS